MTKTERLRRNEELKLKASTLNSIALAVVGAGYIVPCASVWNAYFSGDTVPPGRWLFVITSVAISSTIFSILHRTALNYLGWLRADE